LPLALAVIAVCGVLSLAVLARARDRANRGWEATAPAGVEPDPGLDPGATRTIDQLMADGIARLEQGDVESAVADLQMAIAADPANLDRYWEVSSLFRDYGYYDPARAFADAAVAAGPDESWFHDTTGWTYYYLGAYPEAVSHFQRAVELDPESLWSHIGMSDAFQSMGDWDSSRLALDTVAAHPLVADPDLYVSLGWNYAEQGAYPEAQAAFRQAITLDAAKTGAWSGLVNATYNAEGAQAAWNIAQEAVAANPGDPSLYEWVGDLAWELGDLASAEAAYLSSTELDPSNSSGYTSLAGLYEDQERFDEAVAILELGLESNPQDPWLNEAIGQILLDLGQAEGAFNHFSAAADLDPTYGWFPLQAAYAYYQFTGDAATSASFLERAAAAQPEDADLLDSVGQAYEGMGDCPSALHYYTRALDLNPDLENSQAGLTRCGG
jgi:tetratricopeptide (TPR) repeat protein